MEDTKEKLFFNRFEYLQMCMLAFSGKKEGNHLPPQLMRMVRVYSQHPRIAFAEQSLVKINAPPHLLDEAEMLGEDGLTPQIEVLQYKLTTIMNFQQVECQKKHNVWKMLDGTIRTQHMEKMIVNCSKDFVIQYYDGPHGRLFVTSDMNLEEYGGDAPLQQGLCFYNFRRNTCKTLDNVFDDDEVFDADCNILFVSPDLSKLFFHNESENMFTSYDINTKVFLQTLDLPSANYKCVCDYSAQKVYMFINEGETYEIGKITFLQIDLRLMVATEKKISIEPNQEVYVNDAKIHCDGRILIATDSVLYIVNDDLTYDTCRHPKEKDRIYIDNIFVIDRSTVMVIGETDDLSDGHRNHVMFIDIVSKKMSEGPEVPFPAAVFVY
jgi:hypothetical protein